MPGISRRLRGDLWAIVSASATGIGLIAAKIALASYPTLTVNAYVFFFGMVIICIDAAISRRLSETVRVTLPQMLFLLAVSVIFAAGAFCFYAALSLIEPATTSFLSRLELIFTLIFAGLFLKERLSLAELAGLAIVALGIIVMRYGASVELSRAVLLLTVGTMLTGTAEVMFKWKINWINHRSIMFYRNLFMAATYIIAGLATDRLVWITDSRMILILMLAGFLLPYLGRMGYLKAMRYINISRASVIVQSQPFFAAAAALLILGTFPPLKEIVGGLIIVTGVITIRLLEKRKSRLHNAAGKSV